MPECYVEIRWPDGSAQSVYSPSLIMEELFAAGTTYPMEKFLALTRDGLTEASRRVELKFGHPCSLAAASLVAVERAAVGKDPDAGVEVLAIRK